MIRQRVDGARLAGVRASRERDFGRALGRKLREAAAAPMMNCAPASGCGVPGGSADLGPPLDGRRVSVTIVRLLTARRSRGNAADSRVCSVRTCAARGESGKNGIARRCWPP